MRSNIILIAGISPHLRHVGDFFLPIHNKKPAVERLVFHLASERPIYFNDHQDNVLGKPSMNVSMFTSWMDANKMYHKVRNPIYSQFVSKFVYVKKNRCWKTQKVGYTIERLIWVPPSIDEHFYLRIMLTIAKEPLSYEDIRTIANIQYPTFRETCFASGFLDGDKEYIEAIKEARDLGWGHYLRNLFIAMLLSNGINRPNEVCEQTWECLLDGILYD